MKVFLKIDYFLQVTMFFGYIFWGIVYKIIENDLFSVWFNFYFVVGGFQLISYLIKILMGFWTDLFMKIYGILILPIWIVLLLNECKIYIDLIDGIPFYGMFSSPFLAIAYLFYCRDKSKDHLTEL